jgi:hypothetical protein
LFVVVAVVDVVFVAADISFNVSFVAFVVA